MKFKIGDHLQEITSNTHGIVIRKITSNVNEIQTPTLRWYLIKNDEIGLVNHWVPEDKLELHKQPLREQKLKELGI